MPALRAKPSRRALPKHSGQRGVIADNVLDRPFKDDAPTQKWIANFPYIETAEGRLHLAVALDLQVPISAFDARLPPSRTVRSSAKSVGWCSRNRQKPNLR